MAHNFRIFALDVKTYSGFYQFYERAVKDACPVRQTMELSATSVVEKGEDDIDFQLLDASSYSLRVYKKSQQGQATARRAQIELPTGTRHTLRVTNWVEDTTTLRSRQIKTDDYGTIEVIMQ